MAIATISSAIMNFNLNYQASPAIEGAAYSATVAAGQPGWKIPFTKGTSTANQINEICSLIISISASSNTTINLNSIVDIINQTTNLVRVKGLLFQLLSVAQDSANGTACTGITIGDAGSNQFPFFGISSNGTITLGNGEIVAWMTPLAAGTLTSGANNLKVVNNDSGNAAGFQLTVLGSDA